MLASVLYSVREYGSKRTSPLIDSCRARMSFDVSIGVTLGPDRVLFVPRVGQPGYAFGLAVARRRRAFGRFPFTARLRSSSSQVTMLWKKTRSPSSSPRVTSVMWTFVAPNCWSAHSTAFSGFAVSPQVKMSRAAYPYSGQVCTDMCDSEMTTTPETPLGLNRWKEIDQTWTSAISAARTRICYTASTLPMISALQPEASAM